MVRSFCTLALVLCAATASGQQWAEKMFKEKGIDFGNVPRSAKIEHEFVINNLYQEDVHVASVRSSCGCTEPRVENDTLKPYESGKIIAAFNTDAFSGHRSATVTVTFDKPRWAEVQLQVRGNIRTDISLNPGEINFGSIAEGAAGEKTAHINYYGGSDWKITDVKSASPFVTATIKETNRSGGQVGYELNVKLAEGAPAGYLNEELSLVTNDRFTGNFPVKVEARIVPELVVSPQALMLGTMHPGQKVSKRIVVKAAKPFKIVDIHSEEAGFKFEKPGDAKTVHLVPVIFEAPDKPGKLVRKIEIITDLDGNKSVTISAIGLINATLAAQ